MATDTKLVIQLEQHNSRPQGPIPPMRPVASEIKHFFRVYKSLEGKETVVSDVLGRDEAVKIIIKCQNAYIEKYCR